MSFPERVTDLKAKRRLLEINRSELVRDLAIDKGFAEFKEELNPKYLPGSYKFYANPKNIMESILVNHMKNIKE